MNCSNNDLNNCPCCHHHHNESIIIGGKMKMLELIGKSLESIIKWHKKLDEQKEELLRNNHLNDYIVNNRMENIKTVLYELKINQVFPEQMANEYALAHMYIEKLFDENKFDNFENIFKAFGWYIMNVYDIMNFVYNNSCNNYDDNVNNLNTAER